MFRVVCCKSSIPLDLSRSIGRSFSRRSKYVMEEVAPRRHILPYVTGAVMLATGGAGVYLYKTNSFQMVEFTKRIKDESKDEMKWRDAIATSLVAISNQEQGKKRILRHKWGTTLGNWIIEDSVYQQSTYFNPRRSPYIIEALYALTERDPHFFCDALNSGKTKVDDGLSVFS